MIIAALLFVTCFTQMRMSELQQQISSQDRKLSTMSDATKVLTETQNEMALNISKNTLMIAQEEQTILNTSLSSFHLLKSEVELNNTQLQKMVEDYHQLLETLRADLRSAEEKDRILSEKINHPVSDYFGRCRRITDTCVIGSTGNGRYWKDCPTHYFPTEEKGYITVGEWCSYRSSVDDYSETLTLFEKDNQVRCDCDVTFPGENKPQQRPVSDVDGTCVLTIIRCPTTDG